MPSLEQCGVYTPAHHALINSGTTQNRCNYYAAHGHNVLANASGSASDLTAAKVRSYDNVYWK